MPYYLDLFSPETYEAFMRFNRDVSGFRMRQENAARAVRPGDKLICYMTKLSRWFGVLEVTSDYFIDDAPLFYPTDDPFVVRFKVKVIAWLPKEKSVPIYEDRVWDALSFTRGREKHSRGWTGGVRKSLVRLSAEDGKFLEEMILSQVSGGEDYEVDEQQWRKYVIQRIRRHDKEVTVTVPEEDTESESASRRSETDETVRESHKVQASLAKVGETMGFTIWVPKQDRSSVLQHWHPGDNVLLDVLPLNYDETTLGTIERIDILLTESRQMNIDIEEVIKLLRQRSRFIK